MRGMGLSRGYAVRVPLAPALFIGLDFSQVHNSGLLAVIGL